MLRTIIVGTALMIQGMFIRALPDGRIVVKVDEKIYTGTPVTTAA